MNWRTSAESSCSHLGELRIVGKIVHLVRIGRLVEQERAAPLAVVLGVTPTLGPHGHARRPAAIFAPNRVGREIPGRVWIGQQRHQAAAFQSGRLREAAQFDQRRIDVDRFDDPRRRLSVVRRTGVVNDQRHASALLVQRTGLRPLSLFAQLVAVVAPEDDDRLLAQVPSRSSSASTRPTFQSIHETDARYARIISLASGGVASRPTNRSAFRRRIDNGGNPSGTVGRGAKSGGSGISSTSYRS